MTAADLLIKYLEQIGVKYIFGIPGGALEPFCGAIDRSSKITLILTKHEEGAAFMACGYAKTSGSLGVCCATTGPGSTNLITGVASANSDSLPVLVITAQVPTTVFGKGAVQESTYAGVNIVDIFRNFTKFSAMVVNPDKMGELTREALRFALSGRRGPVHINVPMDVMKGEVNEEVVSIANFIPQTKYFDRKTNKEAATLLLKAKKPAIFLGTGTLLSKAEDEVFTLAKMLSSPVATTPKAKGAFPEDHPLSLGVFGFAGSPRSYAYLMDGKNVDVLLAIGTSFNEFGTHAWDKRIIPEKALVQIDVDPYELGKNYPFDLDLIGDAKTVLQELIYELNRHKKSLPDLKEKKIREKKLLDFKNGSKKYLNEKKMASKGTCLKPQRLMKDLRDSLQRDTIFLVDNGNNMAWAIHYLDIYKPGTFIAGLGFTAMGFGVAAAVGAKFAALDTPVVAIVGDGGFLMNGIEVATAVNYNKQVIWVVENNCELGMVSHARRLMGIPYNIGAEFKRVDFVKIAEGLGAIGKKITKPGEINKEMMDDIIASGKSTVLDVIIDKDEVPPLSSRVKAISEVYL